MVNYKYLVMVGASFLLCLAWARHTGSKIINIFCHHNTEAVTGVILISILTQCSLSRVRDRKVGKSDLGFRIFRCADGVIKMSIISEALFSSLG